MNKPLKRFGCQLFALMATFAPSLWAAAPSGYYSTCEGKSGQTLLTALYNKITSHTTVSYKNLLNVYKTSDVYPDGKIWDMYSTKHWTVGTSCGSYSGIGDCYNREHSMPKSWFNDASPMYSDAFHIYPTDGWVNGKRSNYPFGECSGGSAMGSRNGVTGLGRLGRCTAPGYSGTVFEPDDEYKGDFARTYFYMAACYNDRISSWNSDMLAGNKFPVFKQWAIDLLLKWSRQDPVSEKERNRNDAVEKYQHNRNPFIDHPDLAEHIWGNKTTVGWSASGVVDPVFNSPASSAVIEMGNVAVNTTLTYVVNVKATALTSAVSVALAGDSRFSTSTSSLAAANCNTAAGAPLTLTFKSATAGPATATVTLTSGNATTSFTVKATAYDALTALPATDITDDAFTARWVNIDPAGTQYRLTVKTGGNTLQGYPVAVNAAAGSYRVTGLEPSTPYTYYVESTSLKSNEVTVSTVEPIPSVKFLFDADLTLYATPGTPSDVAEILAEVENIPGDVIVTVKAPFEVSTDKSTWSTSVTLVPEADRFYLRLGATAAGTYATSIVATAMGMTWDDAGVDGEVSVPVTFIENFTTAKGGYGEADYSGDACMWHFVDALSTTQDGKLPDGTGTSVRMGKTSSSCITMIQDKARGASSAVYYVRPYHSDGDASMEVEYSTDGGATWQKAETVSITGSDWKQHTTHINVSGNVRLRFRQTSGARFNIGALSIGDYTMSGLEDVIDYHRWDAYCSASQLVIETREAAGSNAVVYDTAGALRFEGRVDSRVELPLPAGLYIVVVDDFARRVVVR